MLANFTNNASKMIIVMHAIRNVNIKGVAFIMLVTITAVTKLTMLHFVLAYTLAPKTLNDGH